MRGPYGREYAIDGARIKQIAVMQLGACQLRACAPLARILRQHRMNFIAALEQGWHAAASYKAARAGDENPLKGGHERASHTPRRAR